MSTAKFTRPRGTNDITPAVCGSWQRVEQSLMSTASLYGFREIRTPIFEHTELFLRGVGDTTDVVNKEMYTFEDKGRRSITLRPEGIAGITRAAIENGLLGEALPLRVSYLYDCFRYEKPQKGRDRQFRQFGLELYGADSPEADAEIISLAAAALDNIGIKNVSIAINSIGCKTCRAEYHKALREYFSSRRDELCETCLSRLEKNPMRILDCKSPVCGEIAKGAPKILDYLCDDCAAHFERVKALLDASGTGYSIDPGIVRGLDYYTRTVFELSVNGSLALGGGGRYGSLVAELGGPNVEGIGFAMGIGRLIDVLKAQGSLPEPGPVCGLYIASMGSEALKKAFLLAAEARRAGVSAQCDLSGRSLKAQMKYADRIGAAYTLVLGDDELNKGEAELKEMDGEGRVIVKLDNSFADTCAGLMPRSGS